MGICGVECGVRIRTAHNYSLHDGTVHIASKSGIGGGDEARLNRIYINRIPTRKHNGILLTTPARTLLDCAAFHSHRRCPYTIRL